MKYVELFCGAGGTSCGLVRAGWRCVGAADNSKAALDTYSQNFSHPSHRMDLSLPLDSEVEEEWKRELEEGALVASSPCTDFSTANSRQPEKRGEAASLTERVAEIVEQLNPEWFVFENVPRAERSGEFGTLLDSLRRAGYAERHGVVSALGAGVPQTRRRLILFGSRGGKNKNSSPSEMVDEAWENFVSSLQAEPTTMRQHFDSHGIHYPSPFIYIPSCDEKRKKSVFTLDGPAPTIRNYVRPFRSTYPFPPRDDTHDPSLVFAATPVHTASLQGFPPSFTWMGSKTSRAKCIGNAVPPPIAERVGRAISKATGKAAGRECRRQMAIGDWQDEERKREVEEANERSLAARVLESEAHAEWHARAREVLSLPSGEEE